MKLRHILTAITLLFPALLHAEWADISTSDLIRETDFAVIASLTDVKEWTKSGVDYGRGTLIISESLSKRHPSNDKVTLTWSNPSDLICPRTEHSDTNKRPYIWLLQSTKDGAVIANYPGRVLDLKDKKKVLKLLKKNKA